MKAVEILRKILQKFRKEEIKQETIEQPEFVQETEHPGSQKEEIKLQNTKWGDINTLQEKKEKEETEIKEIRIKSEDEKTMKIEFVLANGRHFVKKFKKGDFHYKVGDKIKMVIGPDHIMRDLYPSN